MAVITKAIERQFVNEVLNEESDRLFKNQGMAMRRLLTFHSGQTFSNRSATVSRGDEMSGKMTLKIMARVRFLDLRKSKKGRGRSRAKRLPIYNKLIMGTYYHIANRLMYELTDDVRQRIAQELKESNNG